MVSLQICAGKSYCRLAQICGLKNLPMIEIRNVTNVARKVTLQKIVGVKIDNKIIIITVIHLITTIIDHLVMVKTVNHI
jgi:hypothetical protein